MTRRGWIAGLAGALAIVVLVFIAGTEFVKDTLEKLSLFSK